MEIENGEGLPDGKRIWTWIILCSDGLKPFAYVVLYFIQVLTLVRNRHIYSGKPISWTAYTKRKGAEGDTWSDPSKCWTYFLWSVQTAFCRF